MHEIVKHIIEDTKCRRPHESLGTITEVKKLQRIKIIARLGYHFAILAADDSQKNAVPFCNPTCSEFGTIFSSDLLWHN